MRLGFSGRGRTEMPGVTGPAAGNNLPGITGNLGPQMRPGPSPSRYMGGYGQLGVYDGNVGNDPRFKEKPQPLPRYVAPVYEGQTSNGGQGASLGYSPQGVVQRTRMYGGGVPRDGNASRLGMDGDPMPMGRESFRRFGIQGFNDQMTVKDRHAYWDTGNQKTGIEGFPPAGSTNTYNDPRTTPPMPNLRTVNRTVSYQKGSDKTRNQDDLTRGYSWLGEQGSGWTRISGGVPGLYQPYGTRGGVPFPIVSPVAEGADGDGPHLVNAGPPHGLHSTTPWKGGEQIISRTTVLPQMRPVRFNRPSNSPQAGQSYSQTVRPQGASRVRPSARAGTTGTAPPGGRVFGGGRGWAGRKTGPGT